MVQVFLVLRMPIYSPGIKGLVILISEAAAKSRGITVPILFPDLMSSRQLQQPKGPVLAAVDGGDIASWHAIQIMLSLLTV